MKYVPLYLTVLLNSLLLAIANTFPERRPRWHMSTLWATIIVLVIIIVGIALIYVIVIVPVPVTTTP